MKYSVHMWSITEIHDTLNSMGSYDQALYQQYDTCMYQLDTIGVGLKESKGEERKQLVSQAREAVRRLESDLKESVKAMREAKNEIRKLM